MRRKLPTARSGMLLTALGLGVLLRLVYAAVTPYWVHAYDWQGHQQYVLFVAEHASLPPAAFGWETFQPPLFYVTAALWLKTAALFGLGYGSLQILSVILSIVTLGLGLWIGTLVWKETDDSPALAVYAFLIATCPALVYQASQITNDGLLVAFAALLLGLLLRWNAERRMSDWIVASLVLGLGLLTKSSMLLLLPLFSVIVFRRDITMKRRATLLLVSAVIVTIVAGWFFVLRFGIEGQTSLVGNSSQIHTSLKVPRRISDILVFNPVSVVLQPFADDLTAPRREYLLEHLFRSSLFGHRYVKPLQLASLLAAAALGALLLAARGMTSRHLADRKVLLFMLFSLFAGAAMYRYLTPSIANAHIRFILPVIFPLTVFAVHGATMRSGERGHAALALLASCSVLSAAVVLRLSF